ncbi:MAG: 50S ribosomal protein L4 [Myxococcales bacterium]|nr:50S ribosomal protein L4 [Myxococcales bacterium]
MATVDIHNPNREKVGELDLDDAVFGAEVREHLLYAAVRYQRAKARAGTHKVKERAEVAGGGRKPWRQKGTGRARQGTIRAPQWRGGGVVFGPRVRVHAFKLNRKVRRAALVSAISRRTEESALVVLEDWQLSEIKTRQVTEFMKRFELADMLLVAPRDERLERSARNIPSVTVLPPEGLNVYDVLRRRNLVMTRAAVEAVTARLTGSRPAVEGDAA